MNRIVFLQVDSEDQQRVREQFPDAEVIEGVPEREQLIEACKEAEVISTFIGVQFDRELLEQLSSLKLLCTRSVGYDHIDMEAAQEHGITVCNVPDYGSHVIAEHVFALLLSTLRHIPEGDARVESGTFDYHGLRGMALRGKTIGIVGTGKIGRRTAQIAHGFGMHILAVDVCRTVELQKRFGVQYTEFPNLLSESDIISLHVPANDETRHMVDAQALASMRDGVILVNTARGELIDSDALLKGLTSGKVRYAMLDVLEHEQNFEENKALIQHPNVITTPHIAFYAEESMRNMYEDCFTSIRQWQQGEAPEHVVELQTVVCDMDGAKRMNSGG